MTITLHGVIPESREADNDKGVKVYKETVRLTTDSKTDGQYAIGSACGVILGDSHADDSQVFCTNISPRCTDGYTGWEVDLTYTSERRLNNDPLQDELRVSYSGELYQIPLFADAVTGNPVCNSAGDYFLDPTLMTDRADLIAHIKVNVAAIPLYAIDLQNHVSNSLITISDAYSSLQVAAGLAKYGLITVGDVELRNDQYYYPIQFDIHIRADGWKGKPLDAGFRERKYGQLVQIRNEGDGEEVTSPAPLKDGEALRDPSPANNVILEFNKYPIGNLKLLPGVS